jgi:hypothetical protein
MKIRRVPAMALAVSLILLSSYSRSQDPPERSPTPIIVGDGSIHIKPVGVPFFGVKWVTTNKNQFRTTDNMLVLGNVDLVGTLTHGDWSKPVIIEPIANFIYGGGQVTLTIANPNRDETITIEDGRNGRGLIVTSRMGFRDYYKPIDKLGTELISTSGTWQIKGIEIRPRRGAALRTLDEKYLNANCRAKYVGGCGIRIDVFSGASPARGRGAGNASGIPPQSR